MRKSSDTEARVVIECRGVEKRFYHYEHRTTSLREFFVRSVLRRPLHVRHAQFTLRGLDLQVRQSESVALVGTNGSGKSTALRLIAGVYTPSAGEIRTAGRMAAVIELGAGFHPDLTGAENVALYAAVLGLSQHELAARYPEIVAFADIGEFIEVPLRYYSSGMYARLAFAVAVCVEPDILLLDEVLAVGDQAFRERCLDRLRQYQQAGGTLIVVSHDEDAVRRLCKRSVWLERGQVKMCGATEDILDAYHAAEAAR